MGGAHAPDHGRIEQELQLKALIVLLLACLALPHAGSAQQDTIVFGVTAPRWTGQVTAAATNALLGALTAGVFQELRGGSFKDGFTRGALGGSISYAGKRIAGSRFDGAGLLGREVAAVGSSIVRNASEARPMFESVVLPVGPLRVHLSPMAKRFSHVSLDVVGAGWLIYAVVEPELEFAAGKSLSAGAPVFETNNKRIVVGSSRENNSGITPAGVIILANVPLYGELFLERIFAHERIHVLQEDYAYHTWLEPGERWLMNKVPHGRTIDRYVNVNLSTELLAILSLLFRGHNDRPWEIEAIYFSR